MTPRDAVIVEAVRTPVGKRDGGLAGVHPVDLSAHVLREVVSRAGVDPALVDDVIWGCVAQVDQQSCNVARNVVLASGFPDAVPGTSVDRQCGSSQQAVSFAAAGIVAGHYDVAVAGGVESMSRVPMGTSILGGDPFGPTLMARFDGVVPNQGIGAEMVAERWGLSRGDLDAYSLQSHARAAAAIDGGVFEGEIAPVPRADGSLVSHDEGVRRGGTLEGLAKVRSAYREGGRITAANASQISDGAAALLLMTGERAAALGLRPMVRVHTSVVVGDDPVVMLTGPIPATAKALAKAGLTVDDIGVFEVNEAFAAVTLAWLRETGADPARLNPLGGSIALGHPLGGSGARIMTTMVHHMVRSGIRFGLQVMCEGGGLANATILELVDDRGPRESLESQPQRS